MTDSNPAWWGASGPLLSLQGGAQNRVYRTSGRAPIVIKSTSHSEVSLQWLARVLRIAQTVGLAVPVAVRTLQGQLQKAGWTAEVFVPGEPADRDDLRRLASALRRFHRATRGLPPRPGVAQRILPRMVACRQHEALWRLGPQTCVIHGDLNPGNVIRGAEGVVLIDWDEARTGPPLLDQVHITKRRPSWAYLSSRWVEVAQCWHREPAYSRALSRRLQHHGAFRQPMRGSVRSAGSWQIP